MKTTTTYKLKKPDSTDFFDVAHQNSNMDQLEAALLKKADLVDGMVPEAQIPESAKIKTAFGSYVGTGTSGASNPTRLTLAFTPFLVIVRRDNQHATYDEVILIQGCSTLQTHTNSYSNVAVTWRSNGVEWYNISSSSSTYSYYQQNEAGVTYRYAAFGR